MNLKASFFEIFFKSLRSNNFKSPLILISSIKILKSQMKKNKYRKKINLVNIDKLKVLKLNNNSINLINVDYNLNSNQKIKILK